MSKLRIGSILVVLMVAVMLAAIACAPAAPATTPAKPAEKPAAPAPSTPAPAPATTPAPAAPKALSFQATTYTDDKNGFTVQHPKSWLPQEALTGYVVYWARHVALMPSFMVSIYPTTSYDELVKIGDKVFKTEWNGTDLKWGAPEKITMAGREGTFTILNWNYPGGYNLDTYMASVVKDGKTYGVAVTVMAGTNLDLTKEVISTFQFK